jgi:hypothetical protein
VDLVLKFTTDANGNPTALNAIPRDGVQPDPNSGFYLPELNWVTVTDSMNERYIYDCIQLVTEADGSNSIYAAVSNYRGNLPPPPSVKVESRGLGGAIFALQYRVPQVAPAQGWNYAGPKSGRIVAACDRVLTGVGGAVIPLACPRYFVVSDRPAGRFLLICDNYGVYEAGPLNPTTPGDPIIGRFLRDQDSVANTGTDYRTMRREVRDSADGLIVDSPFTLGVPLVANSVQELPNGNWLITNGYSGSDTSGTRSFSGEIFELSFDGLVPNGIPWCSPPIYVDTKIVDDVKQIIPNSERQRLENGYILQQPRSAARQF